MYKKYNLLRLIPLLLACIMVLLLFGCSNKITQVEETKSQKQKTLFAYVGANLKGPVSDLAQTYEEETGVKIELNFNNSGALLNQLDTMKKGDIYMPGGVSFVNKAKDKGHIENIGGIVAFHTPVMITPKGNPANISSIQDLTKSGVKLVIPDKEATAIGKITYKIFSKLNLTNEIEKNILANVETPAKVMVAITMEQGNVGIVEYSNTFKDKEKIDVVEIDPEVNEIEEIPVAILKYSTDKEEASAFMDYILEEGSAVFEKHGFKTKK